MTTIAYRDGVIAADSRAGRGGWLNVGDVQKLFRVKDGACAVVGSVGATVSLRKWLEGGFAGDAPAVIGDATVIHVSAAGVITVHEDGGAAIQPGTFMAWGSGGPVALGALYAGASAAEAVRIAAKVDPYTGGRIREIKVTT